jgi:plastocyanin
VSRRRIAAGLVLAGAAAQAAVPAQAGVAVLRPQKKTVKVLDNYFTPARLTINPGSTVTWKWDAYAAEIHDVKLVSAPRGVRKWQSDPGGFGYVFRRRLKVPGTYRLLCTFHQADGMRMRIVVRKPR